MAKKKEKNIRITKDVISRMSRAQGFELSQDEIDDLVNPDDLPPGVFVGGCVNVLYYGGPSGELTSVTFYDRFGTYHYVSVDGASEIVAAKNLGAYRETLERAQDHGHGVEMYIRLGLIKRTLVGRSCPDEPVDTGIGGIADGI